MMSLELCAGNTTNPSHVKRVKRFWCQIMFNLDLPSWRGDFSVNLFFLHQSGSPLMMNLAVTRNPAESLWKTISTQRFAITTIPVYQKNALLLGSLAPFIHVSHPSNWVLTGPPRLIRRSHNRPLQEGVGQWWIVSITRNYNWKRNLSRNWFTNSRKGGSQAHFEWNWEGGGFIHIEDGPRASISQETSFQIESISIVGTTSVIHRFHCDRIERAFRGVSLLSWCGFKMINRRKVLRATREGIKNRGNLFLGKVHYKVDGHKDLDKLCEDISSRAAIRSYFVQSWTLGECRNKTRRKQWFERCVLPLSSSLLVTFCNFFFHPFRPFRPQEATHAQQRRRDQEDFGGKSVL